MRFLIVFFFSHRVRRLLLAPYVALSFIFRSRFLSLFRVRKVELLNGNVGQCNTFQGRLPAKSREPRRINKSLWKGNRVLATFHISINLLLRKPYCKCRLNDSNRHRKLKRVHARANSDIQTALAFAFLRIERYCFTKGLLNNTETSFVAIVASPRPPRPSFAVDYVVYKRSWYIGIYSTKSKPLSDWKDFGLKLPWRRLCTLQNANVCILKCPVYTRRVELGKAFCSACWRKVSHLDAARPTSTSFDSRPTETFDLTDWAFFIQVPVPFQSVEIVLYISWREIATPRHRLKISQYSEAAAWLTTPHPFCP